MTTTQRTRIGRWNDIATRMVVYRTDYGIEVDELDRFEIRRRRVFFDDVLLVTYHRQPAVGQGTLLAILALAFAFGSIMALPGSTPVAVTLGGIACGFAIIALIAYARGNDVITIFGKRSKAAVRVLWRKQRARQIFGEICAATMAAQRRRAAEIAASEPPELLPEVELPPSPPEEIVEPPQ